MSKSTSSKKSAEMNVCKDDQQHVQDTGRKPKEPEAHDERLGRPPYKLSKEKEGKFNPKYKGQVSLSA